MVALSITDSADDAGTIGGRLDACSDDLAVAVESCSGEVVVESDRVAICEDGATGVGARQVVGDGEVEGWGSLASLPSGSGKSSGEESGDGDEGVDFGGGWLVGCWKCVEEVVLEEEEWLLGLSVGCER